jgi:DNA invertase Pin-like site-specific DNA recombinase
VPELTDAVGYVRVSMMREEAISPALQQAAQEQWARANRRRITGWVTDLDATGRNFKRKVQGLIQRVERGEVAEIIVYRYDRWGRNTVEALANVERVEIAGGSLVSATEPIDAETAIGRYNRTNAFAMAQMQSDIIGENWRAVRVHRIDEGLPPVGRDRFGYRRLGRVRSETDRQRTRRVPGEEERYVPDEALGAVLAGMYNSYTSGDGGPVIARRLNEEGIPNAYGRRWSGRTVLDVLDAGFGAGFLRLHDPACKCRNGTRCRRKTWVKGTHEPVITAGQWEAYRARRSLVAAEPPKRRAAPVHPVSGLVRCGHCGGALVATGKAEAAPVNFRCSRQRHTGDCPGGGVSVPLAALMEACKAFTAGLAADIDARAATAKARTVAVRAARGDASRLAADLAGVNRKLARLARLAVESDALPGEAWEDTARELREERAMLERRLAAARSEESAAASDPLTGMPGVMDAWDIMPAAVLNKVLRAVIRHVTVTKTAPAVRDGKGHFLPQETEIRVIPRWAPVSLPDWDRR